MKKTLFALVAATVGAAALASLDAAHAHGDVVAMKEAVTPGTIIVRTKERRLYYVTAAGQAISYPVGVGKVGKQWSGTSYISGKYTRPAWSPPAEVRRDKPYPPHVIPGGSPGNPMGVAAMTLGAVESTPSMARFGHFVSYGCIRMFNEDIQDLIGRVSVGARVVVE